MQHILVITPTIFSLLMILFFFPHTQSLGICPPFSCNHHHKNNYFTIHFPFRVPRNGSSTRCGYPRFDLSCSSHGETFLRISNSSEPLIVREIDYGNQILWLSDPKGCIPGRVLTMNLTGSPFGSGADSNEYTFLNCSGRVDPTRLPGGSSVIGCLSERGFTVVSTFERASEEKMVREREMKCEVIKRVVAPIWWPGFGYGYYPTDMSDVLLQVSWDLPSCGDCVVQGGSCGFVGDSGLDVGCFLPGGNGGLPRSARYGLILGAGIPVLLFMIGLTFCMRSRVRAYNQNRIRSNATSSPTIAPQPIVVTFGLDGPTIESYPKTILGESKRLPKMSDGTCPICLSEYQPKETLRAVPECNHYFHAECIDEWLRMNATCPLCRNSPQKSSPAGP